MSKVLVFRKVSEVKYTKASKTLVESILGTLAVITRVKRPELVAHFMPTARSLSAFAKQEPVTRAELHHLTRCNNEGFFTPAAKATIAKAYVVAESDLGREPKNGGERDWNSTGQSVLIYLKDRVAAISAEHGVTVADVNGTDISVTVLK